MSHFFVALDIGLIKFLWGVCLAPCVGVRLLLWLGVFLEEGIGVLLGLWLGVFLREATGVLLGLWGTDVCLPLLDGVCFISLCLRVCVGVTLLPGLARWRAVGFGLRPSLGRPTWTCEWPNVSRSCDAWEGYATL